MVVVNTELVYELAHISRTEEGRLTDSSSTWNENGVKVKKGRKQFKGKLRKVIFSSHILVQDGISYLAPKRID